MQIRKAKQLLHTVPTRIYTVLHRDDRGDFDSLRLNLTILVSILSSYTARYDHRLMLSISLKLRPLSTSFIRSSHPRLSNRLHSSSHFLINNSDLSLRNRSFSNASAHTSLRKFTELSSGHLLKQMSTQAIPNNELRTDAKIPSSVGNFDRVVEPFELDFAPIKVAKWKSRKTGLSVVWAEVDGQHSGRYLWSA